ncbi:MAG TPA: hypothetical protein VF528_20655 [Pyrinomonadaceae bacterium]|jgi:hypothetical protein
MASYYDVTLGAAIPHGSNILNQPCTVTFSYPGGSFSTPYSGTVFAWRQSNVVSVTSAYTNLESAWVGANGGTLSINGMPNYAITNFVKT